METKKSVLVVDDEIHICDEMRDFLVGQGFEVSVVHNTKDCLSLIKNKTFDILFLDIDLPEESGLDILKIIKTIVGGIILISGKVSISDSTAEFLGASAFLKKPFNSTNLMTKVDAILNKHKILSSKIIIEAIFDMDVMQRIMAILRNKGGGVSYVNLISALKSMMNPDTANILQDVSDKFYNSIESGYEQNNQGL
jgi:DNA-binding response OmpR family regulator